jgi:hypothetical protein
VFFRGKGHDAKPVRMAGTAIVLRAGCEWKKGIKEAPFC